MPTYTFRNRITDERVEQVMSMSEREQFIIDHPELEQTIEKVSITDPIRSGVTKRHPGLTEKLKGLKQAHLGSTIDV